VIRKLYDWTIEKAQSPASEKWLGAISFAESSCFPIPIDIMLIPMILADRLKAWRLATITLVTSVLGGIAGYLIGMFLFEAIGSRSSISMAMARSSKPSAAIIPIMVS